MNNRWFFSNKFGIGCPGMDQEYFSFLNIRLNTDEKQLNSLVAGESRRILYRERLCLLNNKGLTGFLLFFYAGEEQGRSR